MQKYDCVVFGVGKLSYYPTSIINFGGGAADAGNATPTSCFSEPAILKLATLTVKSLWTVPTETTKHLILAIGEAS